MSERPETPDDIDYELPHERIAQRPVEPRDAARLLVDRGPSETVEHHRVADLPALLLPGDLVIVNDTRVLPARLPVRRSTGGAAEVLLLEERDDETWEALARPSRKLAPGDVVTAGPLRIEMGADLGQGRRVVRLDPGAFDLHTLLSEVGLPPLPPYIEEGIGDPERYQTVFARFPGSVAAPTAGLHLTPGMFDAMADRGIPCGKVTLHVGVGTFKPLSGALDAHVMHGERCIIQADALRGLAEARSVTAVGTTTLRTLESLHWLACRWHNGGAGPEQDIAQWIHQEERDPFGSFQEAVEWLCGKWDGDGPLEFVTQLMIVPGYTVRSAQRLLTNFHMPNSTLLCIVEAMIGPGWRTAYAHAVAAEYRFLSYGDACLLERPD